MVFAKGFLIFAVVLYSALAQAQIQKVYGSEDDGTTIFKVKRVQKLVGNCVENNGMGLMEVYPNVSRYTCTVGYATAKQLRNAHLIGRNGASARIATNFNSRGEQANEPQLAIGFSIQSVPINNREQLMGIGVRFSFTCSIRSYNHKDCSDNAFRTEVLKADKYYSNYIDLGIISEAPESDGGNGSGTCANGC